MRVVLAEQQNSKSTKGDTVIGTVPRAVAGAVAMVRVTEQEGLGWPAGSTHEVGEKPAVAPLGSPETDEEL